MTYDLHGTVGKLWLGVQPTGRVMETRMLTLGFERPPLPSPPLMSGFQPMVALSST
jgi:hypothetical protein